MTKTDGGGSGSEPVDEVAQVEEVEDAVGEGGKVEADDPGSAPVDEVAQIEALDETDEADEPEAQPTADASMPSYEVESETAAESEEPGPTPPSSVFADRSMLDPARPLDAPVREAEKQRLLDLFSEFVGGIPPSLFAVYGPATVGKSATVLAACESFRDAETSFDFERVDCSGPLTSYTVANRVLQALGAEPVGAYHSIEALQETILESIETSADRVLLVLDGFDDIRPSSKLDPLEFVVGLVDRSRSEGATPQVSVCLVCSEGSEYVRRLYWDPPAVETNRIYVPPLGRDELEAVVRPRLEEAFGDESLPEEALEFGLEAAWTNGFDADRTIRLFRRAGTLADEQRREVLKRTDLETFVEEPSEDPVRELILQLPFTHFWVLGGVTGWVLPGSEETKMPVSYDELYTFFDRSKIAPEYVLEPEVIRDVLADLRRLGLVEIEPSPDRDAPGPFIQTTFEPGIVRDSFEEYYSRPTVPDPGELVAD